MTNQNDAPKWVLKMYADVEKKWQSIVGDSSGYEGHSSGYALFYGPVHSSCDLMIIGFNPGGGSDSFVARKAPPGEHEYNGMKYPLAKKMHDIFDRAGASSLLALSVKTNLNFFRSRSLAGHDRPFSKEIRKGLAEFCINKVTEMIERLGPKVIITEGIGVFDRLKNIYSAADDHEPLREDGKQRRRLYARARVKIAPHQQEITLIGLIHPTGARVATEKWTNICLKLKDDLVSAHLLKLNSGLANRPNATLNK